jgi:hypothetical protein
MMSKLLRILLLVLAVAALQCCGDEAAARVKRRVKPRPKKPLTLEELRFEVRTGMEWNGCTHVKSNSPIPSIIMHCMSHLNTKLSLKNYFLVL